MAPLVRYRWSRDVVTAPQVAPPSLQSPPMRSKPARLTAGTLQLLRGLAREPGLARDLPRWVRDAHIRKDPLRYRRPWWNYAAIAFVEQRLSPGARVFEYGGGASTL